MTWSNHGSTGSAHGPTDRLRLTARAWAGVIGVGGVRGWGRAIG